MNVKPAILQVSAFLPDKGGGIEVVAAALCRKLVQKGYQVTHVAGGERSGALMQGDPPYRVISCRSYNWFERMTGLPFPLWGPLSLMRLVREVRRADIVHIHDYLYFPTLVAVSAARLYRKRVILTQHIGEITFRNRHATNLLSFFNRHLGVRILNACDEVIFVSPRVKQYFSSLPNLRTAHLHVIENGVDHEIYQSPLQSLNRDKISFLFVGRFVEKKGLHLLEAAWDIPGVSWTFIGDGPLTPAKWHGEHASLQVRTGLRGAEVVPYYQQADLLVLPSVGEGFPLVIQEALACGTPVLAGSELKASFGEILPSAVMLIDLSPPDVQKRLKAKLEFLCEHINGLRSLRANAVEVSQRWSWDVAVSGYISLYNKDAALDHSV